MQRQRCLTTGLAIGLVGFLAAAEAAAADPADMMRRSGVRGGLVVHLGCGDGRQTASLLQDDRFFVHGLDTDPQKVEAARTYLRSRGLYGPVSVARFDGRRLPYADNMVNLIVADTLGEVSREEALRVLTPLGVLMVGGRKTVKPWPKEIDDWPQYLRDADNNAVAQDTVVGPPRRVQWQDRPVWCRSHMGVPTVASMVSANGRLFTIEDAAPPDNPFLPAAFRLVARDAFNGKELWARRIPRWESVTLYIKCQPVQQQRRMVAVGDTLYCTLHLEGPLSALDAATGETLRTYDAYAPVQEVAYADGVLYLIVGDRFNSSAYNIVKLKGQPFVQGVNPAAPFYGAGFPDGYAPEVQDKEQPISSIVAVDPETGEALWAIPNIVNYTGASLAVHGDHAVYQAANGLFCVHAKTGRRIWSVEKPIANAVGHDSKTPGTMPNTVMIADGKVFAVEGEPNAPVRAYANNTLSVYSLADGELLWQAPARSNYESSSDVFYVNGAVWVGGEHPTQYDAETGRRLKTIVQKMTGPMGHDRCYRNYITVRYFINSKTGGADFLDLETGGEFPNHWTRGGCGLGVLPANGLLYSTPYSCQCSMGAMFQGLNAYASVRPKLESSDQPIPVARRVRLERGPAYGRIADPRPAAADDWPAYRHDGFRSGITQAPAGPELSLRWSVKLPVEPSPITVAAGKAFVAAVDQHTLYALDADTGRIAWTYTAGGRIDSPPTYHHGALLFGCRDGWVYCLRATDGALVWRFKDLPDRLIGGFGQLESAWPVYGSVAVVGDTAYCAAGRSSYLDGGIFLYALDAATGELRGSRDFYGPFAEDTGFPVGGDAGFKNDVMSTDGQRLYLRHKAFDLELNEAEPGVHIIASAGFLDGQPQHRTSWCLGTGIARRNAGDILVSDGRTYYEVWGFPLYANHSYFDPRRSGYTLLARRLDESARAARPEAGRRRRTAASRRPVIADLWRCDIPITGKAMALAGDVLWVAGEPVKFKDYSYKTYVAAYRGELGGRLLAVSAADGRLLAEYELSAPPAWDSLAAAKGRIYASLKDGTVACFGP